MRNARHTVRWAGVSNARWSRRVISTQPSRLRFAPRLVMSAFAMWALTAAVGCTREVRSDIDSINSELTGPYTVRRVTEGSTYVADVCVANRSRNDLIASQLIHQRLSHGHDAII